MYIESVIAHKKSTVLFIGIIHFKAARIIFGNIPHCRNINLKGPKNDEITERI